jgi:dihydroorotate dehydrogenase electron transfer subunit
MTAGKIGIPEDFQQPRKPHGPDPQSSILDPQSSILGFYHGTVPVVENVTLARLTYRIRLHCPELAQAIRPGQFIMIRQAGTTDPLLGRPFALYDTVVELPPPGQATALDVVYLVVGKLTGLLANLKSGDRLEVWGPLGNGFPELSGLEHVGLVAGGIGQTPFLAYIRELLGRRGYAGRSPRQAAQRVSLYYGVRTADLVAGVEDFRAAGAEVHLATDDGSRGFKGFVTQLLQQHEPPQHLIGCGPEAMMKTLAGLAQRWGVPCHLSLETPMACGLGICFSCVTKVKIPDSPTGWDYRRVCVDGPVFDAETLVTEPRP